MLPSAVWLVMAGFVLVALPRPPTTSPPTWVCVLTLPGAAVSAWVLRTELVPRDEG